MEQLLMVRKMIYFPSSIESRKDPYVIYVDQHDESLCFGSADEAEVAEGRRGCFLRSRCADFTDERWALVEELMSERRRLALWYERLMKGKLS